MDSKIIAILVVAVVVIGGASAYVMMKDDGSDDGVTYNDGSYNIIARVNAEGSGLYIKESLITMVDGVPTRNGTPFYNIVDGAYTVTAANAKAWAGLKLGTPGATSIQHIQIVTLASQMGLNMVNVASSESSDPAKSIYFNATVTNYATAVEVKTDIDGGIVWEPQYSKIVAAGNAKGFVKLALTNDLFPDHTCCTIIGKHSYVTNNADVTERFLAGYVDAVKFIQKALEQNADGTMKNTAEYNELVSICVKYTSGLSDSEIKAALANITYLYADGANGNLGKLTSDVQALAQSLVDLKAATKSTDAQKLGDALVDDTYMKNAVNKTYSGADKTNVRVAVIDGDIHQIAIRVAVEKNYFNTYGITVTVSTGLANGGAVADALIGGQADFGFVGAPPATLKTINAPLIEV